VEEEFFLRTRGNGGRAANVVTDTARNFSNSSNNAPFRKLGPAN